MKPKKTLCVNGYPFCDPLPKTIVQQLDRVEEKRASCIIIDGPIGTGKTTLATEIMEFVNNHTKTGELLLDIKEHPQLSLGGKEFTTCFRETFKRKYKVLTYDEAGDFNRRGAIGSFNQMINRLFETYRTFKVLVILCLPNFNVLDNQLFTNQIPRFLIHIKTRNRDRGEFAVYSLSKMNWVRYWYDELPKGAKHKCYSNVTPNYIGYFYDLPDEKSKKLDYLSTHGKKELQKAAEKELGGLVSYRDIAAKLGRSLIWCKNVVSELKIKHKTIQDRAKLFEGDVIDVLADYIDTKGGPGRRRNL
jgi:hypothetical protein